MGKTVSTKTHNNHNSTEKMPESLLPPKRLRERRRSSVISIDVALSKNFKEEEVKVKVVDAGKIKIEAYKPGRKDEKEIHELVIGKIFDKVKTEDIEVSMKSNGEKSSRAAEINMYIDDE